MKHTRICVNLTSQQVEQLRQLKKESGAPVSLIVRELLKQALEGKLHEKTTRTEKTK